MSYLLGNGNPTRERGLHRSVFFPRFTRRVSKKVQLLKHYSGITTTGHLQAGEMLGKSSA